MTNGSSRDRSFRGQDPAHLDDEDILRAMRRISGYLDITPGDFREVYSLAYAHARRRLLSVPAGEIMTRGVSFVRESQPVLEVAHLLARTQVAGVPVLDSEDRVTGVISEKDFLLCMSGTERTFMGLVAACMSSRGCPALKVRGSTAADIMSSPAVTATAETPLREVYGLMRGRHINRVPVTEEEHLAGILSRDDVLGLLGSFALDPEQKER